MPEDDFSQEDWAEVLKMQGKVLNLNPGPIEPYVLTTVEIPKDSSVLRDAVKPEVGSWTASKGLTAEDLRKAIKKVSEQAYEPPMPYVVHPRHYDMACDLLGLPHGSPLTNADLDRAASLQIQQLAEAAGVDPIEVLGEIYAELGIWQFGY